MRRCCALRRPCSRRAVDLNSPSSSSRGVQVQRLDIGVWTIGQLIRPRDHLRARPRPLPDAASDQEHTHAYFVHRIARGCDRRRIDHAGAGLARARRRPFGGAHLPPERRAAYFPLPACGERARVRGGHNLVAWGLSALSPPVGGGEIGRDGGERGKVSLSLLLQLPVPPRGRVDNAPVPRTGGRATDRALGSE